MYCLVFEAGGRRGEGGGEGEQGKEGEEREREREEGEEYLCSSYFISRLIVPIFCHLRIKIIFQSVFFEKFSAVSDIKPPI